MADLRNNNEIERFLQPKIEIIVKEILAGIEEWNKREIDRVVYRAGQPEVYQRTRDTNEEESFYNAWAGQIITNRPTEMVGSFHYAPEKLSLDEDGVHKSILDADDTQTYLYLADIIYVGVAGHIFGTGFWTEKRNAWERLLKIVGGSKMRTWINRGAKKAGLKISW